MVFPRLGETVPVLDRKPRISSDKTSRLFNILLAILLVNKSVTSLNEESLEIGRINSVHHANLLYREGPDRTYGSGRVLNRLVVLEVNYLFAEPHLRSPYSKYVCLGFVGLQSAPMHIILSFLRNSITCG